MNLKFWKEETPVATEPVAVPEKLPEKPQERGYFDSPRGEVVYTRSDQPIRPVSTPNQAMKIAAAFRCTSILSGSIAAIPIQLKRRIGTYYAVDEDDPIHYALTVRPNPRQTAFELIRNAIVLMLNQGNAYIYPDWVGGELRLTLLSPMSVSYDKMLDEYMVNDVVNNIYCTLRSEDIIHLRGMSLDGGYTGVSVIHYAARVLGIAESADVRMLSELQPGSSYKGFISGNERSTPGISNLNDGQLKDVADRVDAELRAGRGIMYLHGDMKFNPMSMSPADLQILEDKKMGVLEICRFYGVHPDKNFAGQSANYKASEMSQVQFLTDTLWPLLRQIENELYVKLIPRKLAPKYKIEFDMESFYQTDLESLSTYMEKTTQNGLYTVNEWRAKRGKAPVEGGDVPMMSCNVAPINSAKIKGENITSNANNLPPKTNDTQVG